MSEMLALVSGRLQPVGVVIVTRPAGPTQAELDALTAWWKAQRHIGKAAKILVRSRQRVANNLMSFRRLEGATDNVELALKYLDDIERNWPNVLRRAA